VLREFPRELSAASLLAWPFIVAGLAHPPLNLLCAVCLVSPNAAMTCRVEQLSYAVNHKQGVPVNAGLFNVHHEVTRSDEQEADRSRSTTLDPTPRCANATRLSGIGHFEGEARTTYAQGARVRCLEDQRVLGVGLMSVFGT